MVLTCLSEKFFLILKGKLYQLALILHARQEKNPFLYFALYRLLTVGKKFFIYSSIL